MNKQIQSQTFWNLSALYLFILLAPTILVKYNSGFSSSLQLLANLLLFGPWHHHSTKRAFPIVTQNFLVTTSLTAKFIFVILYVWLPLKLSISLFFLTCLTCYLILIFQNTLLSLLLGNATQYIPSYKFAGSLGSVLSPLFTFLVIISLLDST